MLSLRPGSSRRTATPDRRQLRPVGRADVGGQAVEIRQDRAEQLGRRHRRSEPGCRRRAPTRRSARGPPRRDRRRRRPLGEDAGQLRPSRSRSFGHLSVTRRIGSRSATRRTARRARRAGWRPMAPRAPAQQRSTPAGSARRRLPTAVEPAPSGGLVIGDENGAITCDTGSRRRAGRRSCCRSRRDVGPASRSATRLQARCPRERSWPLHCHPCSRRS